MTMKIKWVILYKFRERNLIDMAKKKNKKRKSVIDTIDYDLSDSYKSLIEEIEKMQYQVYLADQKKKRKAKRKSKKEFGTKEGGFLINSGDVRSRVNAVYQLTDEDFSKKILNTINDIKPIAVIIARLVCALIVAILSVDAVKANLTEKSLQTIDTIYKACINVGSVVEVL